jgi:hypothetical protein
MQEATWRSGDREHLVLPAVWLIGIGSVFLVQQLADWPWRQAWPLWVVFGGTAMAASAIVRRRRTPEGLWGLWMPLAVIVVGLVLLASTTGSIALGIADLLPLWPLLVIGVGAWLLIGAALVRPREGAERLVVPLDGAVEASVRVRFGGGELIMGAAEPGALVSGSFIGGVVHRLGRPGSVELKPYGGSWPFGWDRPLRWHMGVTTEVPVTLRLETGANRSSIDLSGLRISHLGLSTGASETKLRLPSSGITSVKVSAGLASVMLEVPVGVAARIRSKLALGDSSVDERRFPRAGEGWASSDYDAAASKVDIDFEGGLGSLKVI